MALQPLSGERHVLEPSRIPAAVGHGRHCVSGRFRAGVSRAGGVGGCNSYFSQATITEDSFAIGEIARTQRSCFYERNMLEQSYFDALKAAVSWAIDNDTLSLLDSAGKPTVIFER